MREKERTFGTLADINFYGVRTLYLREVRRFMKVVVQTVLAPLVTTLLFLAIFALALGGEGRMIGETPFLAFLAPGLVVMAVVQNAFANTSSSIGIAKVQGTIVDYLTPPLSPAELTFAVVMGGVTRGLLVAVAVWVGMSLFTPMSMAHPFVAFYFLLMSSLALSILGFITALWSEKFDQMAAVSNFVITPLSFLSGTFYSIERLPDWALAIAYANPFFYMIDGFRWASIDRADGSVLLGAVLLAALNAALWLFAHWLVKIGYKLKA